MWFIADVAHKFVHPAFVVPLAAAALAVYQIALSYTPLTDYVMGSPRDNFFSANREGILSLIGYCAMYLFAEELSRRLYWSTEATSFSQTIGVDNAASLASQPGSTANAAPSIARPILRRMLWRTCFLSLAFWILWGLCTIVQRTSR